MKFLRKLLDNLLSPMKVVRVEPDWYPPTPPPPASENCCEHGDHAAPEGKRFCSEACLRCEHESQNPDTGCDGICQKSDVSVP